MAGSAFKQACPSCEHPVAIKDASLVGKKVECPQCKFRFVVSAPKTPAKGPAKTPAVDDTQPSPRPKSAPPKSASAKSAPGSTAAKPAAKPGALRIEDDEPEPVAAATPRKKLYLGLGLGAVGLVVLALASYFILGKTSNSPRRPTTPIVHNPSLDDDPDEDPAEKPAAKVDAKKATPTVAVKEDSTSRVAAGAWLTNLLPGDTEHVFHGYFENVFDTFNPYRKIIASDHRGLADVVFRPRLGFGLSDIDDLIRCDRFTGAPWTYTVIHFKTPIDVAAMTSLYGLKPMPNVQGHEYFKATKPNPWFNHLGRIGVGVPEWLRHLDQDDSRPTFMHFHGRHTLIVGSETPIREFLTAGGKFPLLSGLDLTADVRKPEPAQTDAPPPILVKDLGALSAESLSSTPWTGRETRPGGKFGDVSLLFTDMGKVTMTTPSGRSVGTFEVMDGQAVLTFDNNLKYTGKFVANSFKGDAQFSGLAWRFDVSPAPRISAPAVKGEDLKSIDESRLRRLRTYLTINPQLKDMLDRLVLREEDSTEKPLFATATNLDAARVPADRLPPAFRDRFVWRGKQLWDLTMLLEERKPRISHAGSSLLQKDEHGFQYRTEFECPKEADARELTRIAEQTIVPHFAHGLDRFVNHRIEMMKPEGVDPLDPTAAKSRWSATAKDDIVDIRINFQFDPASHGRVQNLASLLAFAIRSEVELATDPRWRHRLGAAAVNLAATGDSKRNIPPGSFPPGTLPRPNTRGGDVPANRLSWMTAILPYLGHETLARQVDFTAGWREPSNWLAARTIVPEFLDAAYPVKSRHVEIPGVGVAPATTHVVGIAGVGLDAADDDPTNPVHLKNRGVFGYNRSATLDELQKGRGAGNVVMMMQIPYDGITGVNPWIAGGGSTVRGVPESNSIAPFVLSTDKDGKSILHKGKRGTYAIMADGSVRFLAADIPDDVLKSLVTIHGPAPKDDFFADPRLEAIADPEKK